MAARHGGSLLIAGVAAALAGLVLCAGPAHGETTIAGGPVSGRWTKADGPYTIADSVTVYSSDRLEIEAGTVIRFAAGKGMTAYGAIAINGAPGDPIVFDRQDPPASPGAGWTGLSLRPGSTMAVTDAIFRNAGQGLAVNTDSSSSFSIRRARFEHCDTGLFVSTGAFVVDRVSAVGCVVGIMSHAPSLVVTNSIFSGNTLDGLANNGQGALSVVNCTLDGNAIGIYATGGIVDVRNSIFSNHTSFAVESVGGILSVTTSGFWANQADVGDSSRHELPLDGTNVIADPAMPARLIFI